MRHLMIILNVLALMVVSLPLPVSKPTRLGRWFAAGVGSLPVVIRFRWKRVCACCKKVATLWTQESQLSSLRL